MKTMMDQSTNQINVTGKLLDTVFRSGTLSDGRAYESANMTVRVVQTYGGRQQISDIPVSMFAAKYTLQNKLNSGFEQLQELKTFKTAQNVGVDEADMVRISRGTLKENNFVTRSGQLVHGWQINTSFISHGNSTDVASFSEDIFIMDMHPELNREDEPTGRLIIKGGIVQYGGNLDVLDFIVENPNTVDYIERNWNINDTVNVRGRIRVTVIEDKASGGHSSWGEDIPETSARTVRELIITTGDDEPRDEEFAYDPAEIKKAFNARKAKIEQMQIDAKNVQPKAAQTTGANKYSWE